MIAHLPRDASTIHSAGNICAVLGFQSTGTAHAMRMRTWGTMTVLSLVISFMTWKMPARRETRNFVKLHESTRQASFLGEQPVSLWICV